MITAKKILTTILLVGLTLISLMAGFNFYLTLFGMTTAIVCCVVFESLRLGCLWGLVMPSWSLKSIALPLYILVAGCCSFAAITQFHADIIEQNTKELTPVRKEIMTRIALIKKTYAEKENAKVEDLENRIDICNRKLANYPESGYWNNRIKQLKLQRENTLAQRDSFLLHVPVNNRDKWIAAHAANLGLDLKPISLESQNATTITTAIQELWGISEIEAKKIVSVIIVVTTEAGIVMLSFVLATGFMAKKIQPQNLPQAVILSNKPFEKLSDKFKKVEIDQFIQKCQTFIRENGRLPYARELGKKQRLMKQHLIDQNVNLNELVKNNEIKYQ